ncbi:unnamed protein product [Spirodela intermedia]|uniref:Copper transport protein n=1 Tax=Spirodela intermedia TaxID=51605 RepID=A0A7I8J2L7_SPIIN|nr:unnamed protein product [Spirodela intermedia]CAA6664222.1 unnamed protein product [Spirodela intermedia]
MMHMTFYWSRKVTLLLDSWRTETWTGYTVSLLAVFLCAAFYQYMEDRRIRFKAITLLKPAPLPHASVEAPSSASTAVAVLFGVNSAIGYLLMLAIMSFNGGVFISVVVGLASGYLAFRSSGEEDLIAVENPCACA